MSKGIEGGRQGRQLQRRHGTGHGADGQLALYQPRPGHGPQGQTAGEAAPATESKRVGGPVLAWAGTAAMAPGGWNAPGR